MFMRNSGFERGEVKQKLYFTMVVFYLRRVYEGGHRGKYFPRQKGALFTLALECAKVKAIAA